jgi:phosphoglycolate phosphatase
MTFKAVIFDLDGTLLNSLEGIADAMNVLLERLGYSTHSLETYKYFVGDGIAEMVRRALPEMSREKSDINKLVTDYRDIYHTTWPKKSPPYEGIPELLDALSLKNIKLAVLSNKSDDFTNRMVSELLPDWKFEVVMGAQPGIPEKPDPYAALKIAEIIGIAPTNIIFMGDSGVDMKTAARANMYPVGVLWGFREAEELLANGAKKLIKHPMELLLPHISMN